MKNVKQELLEHIAGRPVKYVQIMDGRQDRDNGPIFQGTLEEVLPMLDWNYHDGYGTQELFGTIWYDDGTWSERGEYDGSEWWEYRQCPELPAEAKRDAR